MKLAFGLIQVLALELKRAKNQMSPTVNYLHHLQLFSQSEIKRQVQALRCCIRP